MTARISQLEGQCDITKSLDLDNNARIYYGSGSCLLLANVLDSYTKILIVSSSGGRRRILQDTKNFAALEEKQISWIDSINSYPSVKALSEILSSEIGFEFDAILGIGGGSVLDAAKILSVVLPLKNGYELSEVCQNPNILDLSHRIPSILIPTTCGTGSEVTPFATIWDKDSKSKLSLGHESLLPTVVIGDPELLTGLKRDTISSTALDALTQNLESLWNINSTEKSRNLAQKGLGYSIEGLKLYVDVGLNRRSADLLLRASLYSGAAIAITRTAICHAISYPLTARYGVSHGYACTFSLITVLKTVIESDLSLKDLILKTSKCVSEDEFLNIILSFYRQLGVGSILKEHLPPLQETLSLCQEMLGSVRSRNTVIPIEVEDLKNIITESYSLMTNNSS